MSRLLTTQAVLVAGSNPKCFSLGSSFAPSSHPFSPSHRTFRKLSTFSRTGPLRVPYKPRTMAALPVLYPNPADLFVDVIEVFYVFNGLSQGYSEGTGKGMNYSKFSSTDEKKRFQFSSKTGMLLLYSPAALFATTFLAYILGYFDLPTILESVGASGVASFLQRTSSNSDTRLLIVAAALALHFSKRVLEVLFVHRFSGTMDAGQAFIICTSYSTQLLVILYVQLLSTSLPAPSVDLKWLGLVVFSIGISGNAYHHWILSHLRKDGGKRYVVPQGGLFGELVCPHYNFEMMDFVGIALMSQTIMGWCGSFFVLCYLTGRCIQTKQWYLKKVDGFPVDRKTLIPRIF